VTREQRIFGALRNFQKGSTVDASGLNPIVAAAFKA
jgi:hypothetical protein